MGSAVVMADVYASYRQRFTRVKVLGGIKLEALAGEVTAIIGRNGAGKTTLFRVLLGFLAPDRGSCLLKGMRAAHYRRLNGIGFMPEACRVPSQWSASQLLARGVDMAVPRPEERPEAYQAAVDRSGLDRGALASPLAAASKGTVRRITLAYALIGDPHLVVLDEPFAGLDPPARVRLREEIRSAAARGAAVLMSSHNLDEVRRTANCIHVLRNGQLARMPLDAPERAWIASVETSS